MAFTRLSVSNNALDLLQQQPITDTASTTDPAAVAIERSWELALREFLGECFWNWAKSSTTLTAESPAPTFGWTNKFPLPSDFVAVVGLNETYSDTPSDLYELESGYLLTDENVSSEPAQIYFEYIYHPTASATDAFLDAMHPKAVQAFAVLLASKIATPLAQDGGNKALQMLQLYQRALGQARTINGNQNRLQPRFPYQTSTNLYQRFNFTNR